MQCNLQAPLPAVAEMRTGLDLDLAFQLLPPNPTKESKAIKRTVQLTQFLRENSDKAELVIQLQFGLSGSNQGANYEWMLGS
jgi:hypothetical protein